LKPFSRERRRRLTGRAAWGEVAGAVEILRLLEEIRAGPRPPGLPGSRPHLARRRARSQARATHAVAGGRCG
jgi:hypothetical protein